MSVDAAALDVARDEMVRHGSQDARGDLRAGSVIEEDEARVALKTGELRADRLDLKQRPGHTTTIARTGPRAAESFHQTMAGDVISD